MIADAAHRSNPRRSAPPGLQGPPPTPALVHRHWLVKIPARAQQLVPQGELPPAGHAWLKELGYAYTVARLLLLTCTKAPRSLARAKSLCRPIG